MIRWRIRWSRGNEQRMKMELMAWAKAVASMALGDSVGSTDLPQSPVGQRMQYSVSRLQRTTYQPGFRTPLHCISRKEQVREFYKVERGEGREGSELG
jgi:hypothetical protein